MHLQHPKLPCHLKFSIINNKNISIYWQEAVCHRTCVTSNPKLRCSTVTTNCDMMVMRGEWISNALCQKTAKAQPYPQSFQKKKNKKCRVHKWWSESSCYPCLCWWFYMFLSLNKVNYVNKWAQGMLFYLFYIFYSFIVFDVFEFLRFLRVPL